MVTSPVCEMCLRKHTAGSWRRSGVCPAQRHHTPKRENQASAHSALAGRRPGRDRTGPAGERPAGQQSFLTRAVPAGIRWVGSASLSLKCESGTRLPGSWRTADAPETPGPRPRVPSALTRPPHASSRHRGAGSSPGGASVLCQPSTGPAPQAAGPEGFPRQDLTAQPHPLPVSAEGGHRCTRAGKVPPAGPWKTEVGFQIPESKTKKGTK